MILHYEQGKMFYSSATENISSSLSEDIHIKYLYIDEYSRKADTLSSNQFGLLNMSKLCKKARSTV